MYREHTATCIVARLASPTGTILMESRVLEACTVIARVAFAIAVGWDEREILDRVFLAYHHRLMQMIFGAESDEC
jgi:hypothetical protein